MNTMNEEPFIRDCVASIESIVFMHTEFYEAYWNSQEDNHTPDEYERYEQLVNDYEDELNEDCDER